MDVRLLGPLEVLENGGAVPLGGRKQRAVLALLALNAKRALATERIVDELWGEDVPPTAVKMVQVYVSQLRKVLPEGTIRTAAPGYVLDVDPAATDVARFERLLEDGRRALARGEAAAARELLEQALGLWRGQALAEFGAEPFGRTESARLEELHQAALEERLEADLLLGRHAEVVGELDALVARQPLRERPRRQHMLALYRSGRHADALASYQAYRRALDDELGIDPSVQLRELERLILNQDPSLDPPPPATEPGAGGDRVAVAGGRDMPPLAGRVDELGSLRSCFDAAARGERRVVIVTGEPGRGKTTLVDAFLRELVEGHDALVGRGQCVEQGGAGEPYMPILDALSRMCERPGGGAILDVLRSRAPTWLVQMPWLVPPEELEQVERRAFGANRERMLREMVEALERLAGQRTLVLALDDLHWSDPSTIDLLVALARRAEPARLLVVGMLRPADGDSPRRSVHDAARELRLRGHAREIALEPLSETAVAELVASRAGATASGGQLAAIVYEHTRGNPLFVATLLDAWLREGGALARGVSLEELERGVPSSLTELIEQRLSTLDPDDVAVLEAGAVAGGEFASALVAAALERAPDDVERALRDLAGRCDLLQEGSETPWPDGTVSSRFSLTHDLYQEVLYDRLPAGLRARLHGRIGARLEEALGTATVETASEVAEHYLRAREWERAVGALEAAALSALRRFAPSEALEHARAGLRAVATLAPGDDRDRAELTFQMLAGQALVASEGFSCGEAESAQSRALDLARSLGDEVAEARALFALASMHEVQGHYEESERTLQAALALPRDAADPWPLADVHEVLACSLFHQGRFESAIAHADQGLAALTEPPNEVTASFGDSPGPSCHAWAAASLWFLGRPEAALERARTAAIMSAVPAHESGRAFALTQAAVVAQLRREPESTLDWADAGRLSAEERGYMFRAGTANVLRGWARAALGDAQGGIAVIRAGLDAYNGTGAHMDDPYYLGLLADAHATSGDSEQALEIVEDALARIARTYFYEAELLRLRGELLRRLGREEEGRSSTRRALERAREMGSPSLELRAAVDVARLRAEEGDVAGAAELVRSVRARFTEGFDTVDMRAAEALLVELGSPVEPLGAAPAPASRPAIRYARSNDLSIAYQVTGSGPPDLVLVPGFTSHLEKDWEEPRHARFLERLGSLGRLIRFDKRGTGLSDRPLGVPDLETRMDDVRAVMDAASSERAVVFGYSEGGPLSVLFAATYPERVEALVLFGTFAKRLDPDDDYPWAPTRAERAAYVDRISDRWGFEADMAAMCPSADEAMKRWWGERCRAAASPGAVRALLEMNSLIDVRDVLGAIRVPTLVLHRTGDLDVSVEEGRYIASRIPGARFVELPGLDHFVAIDPDQILDVVEPFVRDRAVPAPAPPRAPPVERVLATILVTDIVSSTETLGRVGDRAWSDLLSRHRAAVRDELARFSGTEMATTGDGFLAAFDGPSRAVRCALAITERLAALGIECRCGVHTGEVEHRDGELLGIAVHTAFRVADDADVGEVVVTATTRDLVAGSGLEFLDRGERALKGIGEPRRLYSLRAGRPAPV